MGVRTVLLVSFALGLVTAVLARVASAAPCAVSAQAASVQHVSIHPAGEEAFAFSLAQLPMEARLSGTNAAQLEVKSPLRFTTLHPWNNLGVNARTRTSLLGGRLVVPKGALVNIAANKHNAESSELPVTLPLHELRTRTPLLVPCAKLTLPRNVSENRESPQHLLPETEIVFAITSKEFALYAKPKAVAPWHITFSGALRVLKRSGSWIHVEAKWSDGSILRG
jgi:hypothetical protein